jgi:cobyrinic acid a,c-diamide synthase
MNVERPRIVVAGTGSGVGKTTVALGLMAAFGQRDVRVQGFKTGPDYIDPGYHTAVTSRTSRNLDVWMMGQRAVREVFERASEGADLSVVEGVMGLYDGRDPLSDQGSTAELAVLLDAPVLLVVEASGMARSAAAMVLGYARMNPRVRLAGVIVNRVGGAGHFDLLQAAVEQVCHVPVLGYLTERPELLVPERHLGLVPALERGDAGSLRQALAAAVESSVDVGQVMRLARSAPAWQSGEAFLFAGTPAVPSVTVAVARDSAFNFYYPENLELLAWHGAEIRFFSPLAGERIPDDADGLYLGGGFPEEFAAELSRDTRLLGIFGGRIREGLPTFAECGGFMFLTRAIIDNGGRKHGMTGVIPAVVQMQERLAGFGYREVRALRKSCLLEAGERVRGHEFRYSTARYDTQDVPHAYETSGSRTASLEGYACPSLLAGYTHLHFASQPAAAPRFIRACQEYRAASR